MRKVLFLAAAILSLVSCARVKENRALAEKILSDPLLDQVEAMAVENIKGGVNAGSGYGAIWIRDFNTFETLAMDVLSLKDIEEVLLTFMLMQDESGSILDGYRKAGENDQANAFTFDAVKDYVGHKNTVETDQESSFILAVSRYVKLSGNTSFLEKQVGDMTVTEHVVAAMNYLLHNRYDEEHGLLWGGTTADWGDVQPEHERGVLLDENSHYSLDIYDNALFISALNAFLDVTSDKEIKDCWGPVRDGLKANVMKYLWDEEKTKFRPHVYLAGSPFPEDFDEDAIMYHGGTGVAMEAGLLTKKQIGVVNGMMLANQKAANANSIGLSMYPAYPTGYFKNPILTEAYTYQNGGDWTWFGGRIITQLVKYGYVAEAYDEIRPMLQRAVDNGDFHEWYSLEGEPRGSASYRGAAGVLYEAIKALRTWAENNSKLLPWE